MSRAEGVARWKNYIPRHAAHRDGLIVAAALVLAELAMIRAALDRLEATL